MEKGDIVARKSYGCDIFFRIIGKCTEKECSYVLQGINYRLRVDADESDLQPVSSKYIRDLRKLFNNEVDEILKKIAERREREDMFASKNTSKKPGKVLHIDADEEYLKLCLANYKKLEVPCTGEVVPEHDQPKAIQDLLKKHMPDILIITGHDSLSDPLDKENMGKYKSSTYFVEAVKNARLFQPSKDGLVIIAGACQSFYEALIDAGANVASSPARVLIHALDPLLIAEKISYTPAEKMLGIDEIIENTITRDKGMGGYQTRGTLRLGSPVM